MADGFVHDALEAVVCQKLSPHWNLRHRTASCGASQPAFDAGNPKSARAPLVTHALALEGGARFAMEETRRSRRLCRVEVSGTGTSTRLSL